MRFSRSGVGAELPNHIGAYEYHVNLPPDLEQEILAEAQAKGVSFDELIETLIWQHAAGCFRDAPQEVAGRMVQLEDGMWALRTGHPLSADTVNDTIDALRLERDIHNL
jgi:hypothetical protein